MHLNDPTKSLDRLNVMYYVMKIFIGNVVKNSSFCFHTIIEFGSLTEIISRMNIFLHARFLHSTFAAVECVLWCETVEYICCIECRKS